MDASEPDGRLDPVNVCILLDAGEPAEPLIEVVATLGWTHVETAPHDGGTLVRFRIPHRLTPTTSGGQAHRWPRRGTPDCSRLWRFIPSPDRNNRE
jgi:hypothetical protein